MNLSHLAEGAPVRVFDNLHPSPAGGWEGRVESPGRRYLVISFTRGDDAPEREIRVKREDGCSPDQYSQFRVMTPEAADAVLARRQYQTVLHSAGITVDMSKDRRPDDDLIAELAGVVQRYQEEHREDGHGTGTGG
jgi:hypothetical protein